MPKLPDAISAFIGFAAREGVTTDDARAQERAGDEQREDERGLVEFIRSAPDFTALDLDRAAPRLTGDEGRQEPRTERASRQ